MKHDLLNGSQLGPTYWWSGFCPDTKEWVQGCLMTYEDGWNVIYNHPEYLADPWLYGYRVEPETLHQCTGLSDDNWHSIFDGDILLYTEEGYKFYKKFLVWNCFGAFGIMPFDIDTLAGMNSLQMGIESFRPFYEMRNQITIERGKPLQLAGYRIVGNFFAMLHDKDFSFVEDE